MDKELNESSEPKMQPSKKLEILKKMLEMLNQLIFFNTSLFHWVPYKVLK